MKKIEVGAAVICRDNEILLTSRPEHQDMAGFWEFPGGKIEPGESVAQCLIREIKEELDVKVRVFDTIYMLEHDYPDKTVSLHFVRCQLDDDQPPRPLEGQDAAWVERDSLDNYPLLPADKPVADFLRFSCIHEQ
ncbi:MAG: 8-oxo-dGTP diphosphatase MutT [Lentisphaerae bacterium]|nr:8-oxo-dGTP diphosphatase MutT [Lentisphaerota bacterium]MCP4102857.1 8-oxo-dGTP diphosphatase MutT [Lentisphaerota bacterium]